MHAKSLLNRLGFTDHEARLYLGLVESGPVPIATIAKKIGLHRPTVYAAMKALQGRGLVTSSKRGARAVFIAEPPEKLEALFRETERALYGVLPELRALASTSEKRPAVKMLEGKKGIGFVFDDLVKTLGIGDVFYRYSSAKESREEYLPRHYRQIRDEKKLERFVITSSTQAKTKKPRLDRAIKIVPEKYGLFDQDVTQIIYGNKVAIIDYNSETALLIENPVFAEFQRNLFKMLYDKL